MGAAKYIYPPLVLTRRKGSLSRRSFQIAVLAATIHGSPPLIHTNNSRLAGEWTRVSFFIQNSTFFYHSHGPLRERAHRRLPVDIPIEEAYLLWHVQRKEYRGAEI